MNAGIYSGIPPRISRGRLWFGVYAAAAAWIAQNLLGAIIGSWTGERSGRVKLLLAAITLAMLGLSAAGGIVSYQNWRGVSQERRLVSTEGHSRDEFLALVGIVVSVCLALGIIWSGISLLLVPSGVRAR